MRSSTRLAAAAVMTLTVAGALAGCSTKGSSASSSKDFSFWSFTGINAKADVTVIFYERLKVLDNQAFEPDALDSKQVAAIVERVKKGLARKR